MARFVRRLLLFLATGLFFFIQSSIQDQSASDISAPGREFVPIDSSLPPLLTFTTKKLLYCTLECNKRIDCRTFDFDDSSRQCRLWDTDTTTGSIVASPSKPQSVVGTIRLSPSTYVNIHNQSCDKCAQSRYETCNATSSTCQCPLKTFWNGSMCSAQLLRSQICSRVDACRSDLNLTYEPNYDFTYRCSDPPMIGVGQTVAGFCNDSIGGGSSGLQGPWGIYVSPSDGNLYVTDWDLKSIQAFPPFARTGVTLFSTGVGQPVDVFVDSSKTVYITDRLLNSGAVYVQRAGMNASTFPAAGWSTGSCLYTGLYTAYGVAVDRSGNIYVAMFSCYMVVKWAPNTISGTLVAGKPAIKNSTSTTFGYVRLIHLNEDRGTIYVTDTTNNRIQKFIIGGNGTGLTVAGNGTAGVGLNQLNGPSGVWVTRDDQTIYVADNGNSRVTKWILGATQGSVVAGSASGATGITTQLLNGAGDIALDPTETYLYVADYGNHRVQRFRLQ